MLARVLAVRHGTIERYEAGARLPPLVALFYDALVRAIALVGPDETWGPAWLTRSQRIVWILQVAEGCSCLVDAPASVPARGARRRCEESVIAEPDARARMLARRLLAVSQKEMADLFGFEHWVVHRWEAGSSHPRGLACDLYAAIPAAVQRHGRVTACYQVLRVSPAAPPHLIRRAWETERRRREAAGDFAGVAQVDAAFAVLGHPTRRAAYDRALEASHWLEVAKAEAGELFDAAQDVTRRVAAAVQSVGALAVQLQRLLRPRR